MIPEINLDKCLTFINLNISPTAKGVARKARRRAITISRQAGSGAHVVAPRLAEILQKANPDPQCPWTVFDRNLVEKVLQDHNLPKRLGRFMPEDRVSVLTDIMDDLFGLHPPAEEMVRQVVETVLRLAELGNVILIGRAANVITSPLEHVFHVRLIGSLARRIGHVMELQKVNRTIATQMIDREDGGRRRYLKTYFDKDIDDPLLYHMVINTDSMSYDAVAQVIANAVSSEQADYRAVTRPDPEALSAAA
jgi:cytidylate kinase